MKPEFRLRKAQPIAAKDSGEFQQEVNWRSRKASSN
jgi:hypothetical protein